MSETKPHEPTAEEIALAREAQQRAVDEAAFLLTSWYEAKDSDSVRRQELRTREYGQACDHLRLAVGASQKLETQVVVTVPEDSEPVLPKTLSKMSYGGVDVSRSHLKPIDPGSSFVLKTERTLTNHIERVSYVYFGGYSYMLEAADIAEILAKGGKLEISSVEPSDTNLEIPPAA